MSIIYFDKVDWLIGILILLILLPILAKRKHTASYLLFFSIFWVYLLAVVQLVIFPIAINTADSGAAFVPRMNLIPFYFGNCSKVCVQEQFENILLTLPFGFGINFLARVRPVKVFWLAIALGFGFEFSQLLLSLAFKSRFRAVDINDLILNASGVLLGYAIFRAFAWMYLKITRQLHWIPRGLFADIYEIALQSQPASRR